MQSKAECPLSCECLSGLFKIGTMFFWTWFRYLYRQGTKKFCRGCFASPLLHPSPNWECSPPSWTPSLKVDGDRTVLFQLRIGLQLRCPAVVALAAILLQDPKRCLS